jgi:hypothetical protein
MEKKAKPYLIALLFIGMANLVVLIFFYFQDKNDSPKTQKMILENTKKISPENAQKILGTSISYLELKDMVGKFRDTLNTTFNAGYKDIHTGGVRFTFDEIKAYLKYLDEKASLAGIATSNLYVYICPGMYTDLTADPTHKKDKLTCVMAVTMGRDIFDPSSRKLTLLKANLFGAYDWGDLEP